jgi:hypothetical protein
MDDRSLYIPNLYPDPVEYSEEINEQASRGLCQLYWNDAHLGYMHDGTAIDYKKTPKVKQYYRKGTPDKASKELIMYYKEEVTVSLFYSDEKKALFDGLGANEGTLKLVEQDGTEKIMSGMSAVADFATTYTKDGKDYINVTFTKLAQ